MLEKDLKIDSELSALKPQPTENELRILEDSLKHDGCLATIKVTHFAGDSDPRYFIVDGEKRFNICLKNGIDYEIYHLFLSDRDDCKLWIINNQLGRRNLTDLQKFELEKKKIEIEVKIAAKKQQGTRTDLLPENGKRSEPINTQAILADKLGWSKGKVAQAQYIDKHADEKTKEEVRKNNNLNQVYHRVKQEVIMTENKKKKSTIPTLPPFGERYKLFNKDFRDITPEEIPNNSIKWIITDPPWVEDYLDVFEPFSKWCSEKLVDGGSVICMIGQYHLDRIMADLGKYLQWHWLCSYVTPGQGPSVKSRRITCGSKPLLWFVKGNYKGCYIHDVFESPAPEKEWDSQGWGQSTEGFKRIIEAFTLPGETVLDPFVGGGTTGVASLMTNRQFIGIDIQQEKVETTLKRFYLLEQEKENILKMPNTDLKTAG